MRIRHFLSLAVFVLLGTVPVFPKATKELAFETDLPYRAFAQRSLSVGLGYIYQSYPIAAQLETYESFPVSRTLRTDLDIQIQTHHLVAQFTGLGPASFHNFWLGYKFLVGYSVSSSATSPQLPKPLTVGSAYISHQQMLGYLIWGMRVYTMLGLTSDLMLGIKYDGAEKLKGMGPDGIFAHSGGGIFIRLGQIILNAELRVPFWRTNASRQTGLHGQFSVSYETFG